MAEPADSEMLSYIPVVGHGAVVTVWTSGVDALAPRHSIKATDLQHDRETFVNLGAWGRS